MKRMSELGMIKGLVFPTVEGTPNEDKPKPRNSFMFGPRRDLLVANSDEAALDQQNMTPQQIRKKPVQITKKRVEFDQVKQVGYELALKFRYEKLSFEDICKELMKYCDGNECLSIVKVKEAIQKPPFLLKEPKLIELVARYLVEDNFEIKVIYNENLASPFLVVSTILKRLLECYTCFTDIQETQLSKSIKAVLSTSYRRLGADFASVKSKQGDLCSKEQLLKVFSNCEVYFSPEEFNLILIKLYSLSKDPNKFPFYSIFQCFDAKPETN